ncbi:RNA polymerase sigma factor [Bacillus sp. KH172YL63]|uniref:RNA polymerase sigma factor n=1 Tax=Bacillus sp. KH172YL63 TaxID=2709784 RepID=UPI0013E4C333|nr:sigma-70 family RNA polymerase sigma factor [Bacillus sp. KH172YL63]BCB02429.1 hypothetical protein KH172YL63_05620 [Bacillus sp. KH172YL63]
MTRNTCLDALRKRKKHESVEYIEKDSMQVSYDTPADQLEWKEKGMAIRDCIQTLKKDQQRIVQLFYFKGLTQQSIADSADIPLGTVKGRIRLARNLNDCSTMR